MNHNPSIVLNLFDLIKPVHNALS